jgi:hypothetical protein
MQTFLPWPDFERSARSLDDRRLGKQRVEAMQVLRALTRPTYGWQHHPAVRMWRGHEEALGAYALAVCREWRRRSYADTCAPTILADLAAAGLPSPPRLQHELGPDDLPDWLGDEAFHRSHRSALLRKDPQHYAAEFAGVPDDLPYVWPPPRDASMPG